MLELLKSRLPDGLEVSRVGSGARAWQLKVWFVYDGTEVLGYLPKSCAPGCEEHVCDMTICSAMMKIGLERNDKEMVRVWNDRINNLVTE